jgi:phosphoglycerate dehydrogenase-like enzyme
VRRAWVTEQRNNPDDRSQKLQVRKGFSMNRSTNQHCKLTLWPAVDTSRLRRIRAVDDALVIANCETEAAARDEIADSDGFIGKLTPGLLASAKRLRWVQAPTASLEHYMFPELIEHPCTLTNMRGLFSDVIADHVFGLVLCFARNLHTYIRRQLRAEWAPVGGESERTGFRFGPASITEIDRRHQHLADLTLGVVGAGAIGCEVLRRAAAFGMRRLAVDPVCRAVPEVLDDVWFPERLDDLLAESDYVVIAAPHTPSTEKLFRMPRFQAMKRTAVLINIGRGAIVDLNDLTMALTQRLIAGAGLDVFEVEPLPANHPLWRMENVIITPHIAGTSPRIAERHLATLLENVRRFSKGEELLNVVDKRNWF